MDIESLKNIKPIDILGLKNFRIFDKQNGFLESFPSISLFTGANNSGKSSIIKALQMLKNSINGYRYPFNLDLNEQEHLLGDFQNILWNKQDHNLEITLPFLFIGLKNFCISLTFETSKDVDPYYARLRQVEIKDTTDMTVVFAFSYREATEQEKAQYGEDFKKKLEEYESKSDDSLAEDFVSKKYPYFFKPSENPLIAYVEWRINNNKVKHYLSELAKAYGQYLQNQSRWRGEGLKELDDIAKDMIIIPSSFISSFKKDPDQQNWKVFIDTIDDNTLEITGKEHVGDRDFDADEYFIAPPEIETVLFQKISAILKKQLKWKDTDQEDNKYYLIEHFFSSSWEGLLQRIATINYVSNIKEENARSYNAASNSPFVKLLKSYAATGNHTSEFVAKYLGVFEIGKDIKVTLDPKHQSILVSITTLNGDQRDLVDFGYGIKQLVLVIMQINILSQRNRRDEHIYDHEHGEIIQDTYIPSILIIEEPESNLHPKWQSKLADMFAEANSRFNIQLIIETHSEYLIRKFQTLVAEKKISSGNVKIFYLRHALSMAGDKKQIETLLIEDDGSIDFNIFDDGFFDENYNLQLGLLNVRRDKFLQDFEDLKKNHQESEDKVYFSRKKSTHI